MKTPSRILLFVTLCLFLTAFAAPVFTQAASDSLSERVDAYITETMHRLPIPGLAVGIVKGDQVLYMHGYGTANLSSDPVTPETPFQLASITKTFTALAVQQLADAGKINLDAPVQAYIPEFRLAGPQASAAITVQHLLDHTSGISQKEGNEPYFNSPNTDRAQAMRRLGRFTPKFRPGEHYDYSNWNYALLSEIVTRTSGRPYAAYIQANILAPLEMSHSSVADYHTLPGAATGHKIVFGLPVPYDVKPAPATLGAEGLNASVEDMTHYLISYFNQGQYHGYRLLPAQGIGWYSANWNWHAGPPNDSSVDIFSGGYVNINTNITLLHQYKVGVVVLMNVHLCQPLLGPQAWEIAFNIARMAIGSPYEAPSIPQFYLT